MTGLEKIKSQILDEAKAAADSKVAEAKEQAGEIVAQAEAEAKKISETIAKKSELEAANYRERITSSIDLQRRTHLLEAKQEMIKEVLDKAYQSLESMNEEEYFGVLLKLLAKYTLPQDGEIFFSAEDLQRMSDDFKNAVDKTAREKGGSLIISKEERKIENGFVLAYGGIEENCTLQAIFDAKKDELSDKVSHILFA
ncbi:MAG: V-type ATP synthase subunit E family protein [Lachnospiraceae bacterium]|nr:V-type ATP synthase subunit E family protein [Lachnospiraceae bacterium]